MVISERVKKIVFGRCGNRCAFPDCNQLIAFKEDSSEYANVGELAHIKGDKPRTARYDSNQSDTERNSADNLILLCGTHHKIIDDQEDKYSIERLIEIKENHEKWVLSQCSKQIGLITFVELEIIKSFIITNSISESDISAIHPRDKIKKNELSPKIENLIKMGLSRSNLVKNYIDSNLDVEFGERLKQGFINKYTELKKESNGDELFESMLDFACGNSSDFKEKAAGLTILSYFFEKCDIFEK
ncbi:MAG: HNH endonuclease [Nanoarchaeota archaeon]|nr:HNH endonuclease [Nanoarchaeota archaeon]